MFASGGHAWHDTPCLSTCLHMWGHLQYRDCFDASCSCKLLDSSQTVSLRSWSRCSSGSPPSTSGEASIGESSSTPPTRPRAPLPFHGPDSSASEETVPDEEDDEFASDEEECAADSGHCSSYYEQKKTVGWGSEKSRTCSTNRGRIKNVRMAKGSSLKNRQQRRRGRRRRSKASGSCNSDLERGDARHGVNGTSGGGRLHEAGGHGRQG